MPKPQRTDIDTSVSDATIKREDPAPDAAPAADPHRVESLDVLEATAKALDAPQDAQNGAGQGTGGPKTADAEEDPADAPGVAELVDLLEFARSAADPMLCDMGYFREGQLEGIWSRPALIGICAPLVQLVNRHGEGMVEKLKQYGPYIGLAIGAAMPTIATMKVLRENRAAAKPAEGDGQQ